MELRIFTATVLPLAILVVSFVLEAAAQLTTDPKELLNWCIDSQNHKEEPGEESELYSQCTPWKKRSCCTHNTTKEVHDLNMYNFNVDHCHNTKQMSPKCREHFTQDLCFYECEPNLGPWVVQVKMKIRNERYYKVPLCKSDCDTWFESCKDDYTCADNWLTGFDWKTGKNECPADKECKLFKDVYANAREFCETVWDHSWLYTPDNQPCMRIWFNGSEGNPNDGVALHRVNELGRNNGFDSSSHHALSKSFFTIVAVFLITAYVCL